MSSDVKEIKLNLSFVRLAKKRICDENNATITKEKNSP